MTLYAVDFYSRRQEQGRRQPRKSGNTDIVTGTPKTTTGVNAQGMKTKIDRAGGTVPIITDVHHQYRGRDRLNVRNVMMISTVVVATLTANDHARHHLLGPLLDDATVL